MKRKDECIREFGAYETEFIIKVLRLLFCVSFSLSNHPTHNDSIFVVCNGKVNVLHKAIRIKCHFQNDRMLDFSIHLYDERKKNTLDFNVLPIEAQSLLRALIKPTHSSKCSFVLTAHTHTQNAICSMNHDKS